MRNDHNNNNHNLNFNNRINNQKQSENEKNRHFKIFLPSTKIHGIHISSDDVINVKNFVYIEQKGNRND